MWKTPLPRKGYNSPIVVDKKVFLSCADEDVREILCINADTGEVIWRKAAGIIPGAPEAIPEIMAETTYAASTMATDGQYVFAIFGTGAVVCFDLEGVRKWARYVGPFENDFGHGSSLITYKGLLYLQLDDQSRSRLLALSTESGKTVWETARDGSVSWSTPVIANSTNGIAQLLLNGNPTVMGYDPQTGEERWRFDCMGGEVATSPAYINGTAFFTTEYHQLVAINTAAPVEQVWEADGDLPDVASPLAHEQYIFLGSSSAVLSCYDSSTGELLWYADTPEGFYCSPVLVGDHVYIVDKEGRTFIFEAASEYKLLASPELKEMVSCTPAYVEGRIYIRGDKHLFCIGEK